MFSSAADAGGAAPGARRRGRLPDRRASSISRLTRICSSSSARNASRFASAAAASAAARGSNAYSTGSAPDMAKDFRGGRGRAPRVVPIPASGRCPGNAPGRGTSSGAATRAIIPGDAVSAAWYAPSSSSSIARRAASSSSAAAYASSAASSSSTPRRAVAAVAGGPSRGPRRRPGRRCYRPTTGTFEDRRRRGSRRPDRGPARG